MRNSSLLLALLFLGTGMAQLQMPVSNCLANCKGCLPADPFTCLTAFDNTTNLYAHCVPLYNGTNCTAGGSYYVPPR
jgi:hypothetical protein